MYCLKCKRVTDTIDQENSVSKTGRHMIKGKCSVCGARFARFAALPGGCAARKLAAAETSLTSQENETSGSSACSQAPTAVYAARGAASGSNILNGFINKLPFEAHLPGHNFTGPGTKLEKRLNPDLTSKEWSKPINRVDEAAYKHDICYLKYKDTATRNEVCDKSMLDDLDNIINPTLRERFERGLVSKIINTKVNFGLGVAQPGAVPRACEQPSGSGDGHRIGYHFLEKEGSYGVTT